MAIYYTAYNVTAGTGAGTLGDPWNINDVCVSGNPKSIASNDVVALITDGANNYTATTNLATPAFYTSVVACDASGKPTLNLVGIDFSGVVAGNAWSVTTGNLLFGIHVLGGAADGFDFAGDLSALVYCKAADMAAKAFDIASGDDTHYLAYCIAQGCAEGFNNIENGYNSTFYKCSSVDIAGAINFYAYRANFLDCIVVMDPSVLTAASSAFTVTNATFGGMMHNCVAYMRAGCNDAFDHAGFVTSSGFERYSMFNNIAQGFKNAGAGTNYGYQDTTAGGVGLFAGNVAYDCDVAESGMSGLVYDATSNVNPSFTDAPNLDFTPGVDLTTYALIKKILNEGTDWTGAGPIPLVGGGGGMIVHPGMTGGLRG